MTEENKQLLLKDLCARLPYGVMVETKSLFAPAKVVNAFYRFGEPCVTIELGIVDDRMVYETHFTESIKPYLRPMSSMTEEEFEKLKEYSGLKYEQLDLASYQNGTYKCLDFYLSEVPSYVVILVFDWLNAHHFDYRGLIDKGLALEASDNMYNN